MPLDERVRTHDRQQLPPGDEARQQDEGDTGRVIRALRSDLAFDVGCQLLPEEQVLGRELRPGLERQSQQPQQVSEQDKYGSDHLRRSYRSACRFRPFNFGGDRIVAEYNQGHAMSRDEPKAGRGDRDELTPHRVHLPCFAADTEVGLGR